MDTNIIHTGDCFDVLPTLPDESVHMVMTSPPYWNLRDYDHADQLGLEPESEQYVQNMADVFDEVKRVLRPDGSLWLNLGDTYDDKDLQQIPARVALELQNRGWILRNRVTWAKPNPMPQSVKDRLNDTTEAVFHFVKERDYWYDLDAIREPYSESMERRKDCQSEHGGHEKDGWGGGDHHEGGGLLDDSQTYADTMHLAGKNPGDVFTVTTKPFPEAHFAVYPPELCEKPIKATCPPKVCAECGSPYEREPAEEIPVPEANPKRPNARRAKELFDKHGLTDRHKDAIRAVGIHDEDYGDAQKMATTTPEGLAAEAKDALGPYFREYTITVTTDSEWRESCDCDTDATEAGIALDPFAGAGTTALVAKNHGRRFVGIDLNEEYVAMAQKRLGLTVDNPEHVRDDADAGLEDFA